MSKGLTYPFNLPAPCSSVSPVFSILQFLSTLHLYHRSVRSTTLSHGFLPSSTKLELTVLASDVAHSKQCKQWNGDAHNEGRETEGMAIARACAAIRWELTVLVWNVAHGTRWESTGMHTVLRQEGLLSASKWLAHRTGVNWHSEDSLRTGSPHCDMNESTPRYIRKSELLLWFEWKGPDYNQWAPTALTWGSPHLMLWYFGVGGWVALECTCTVDLKSLHTPCRTNLEGLWLYVIFYLVLSWINIFHITDVYTRLRLRM